MISVEEFRSEWYDYLDNIGKIVDKKEYNGGLPVSSEDGFEGKGIMTMIEDITNDLKEFSDTIYNSLKEEDSAWLERMTNELRMWNHTANSIIESLEEYGTVSHYLEDKLGYIPEYLSEDEVVLNNSLSQAKTVKDSIETFISPGPILSRLLKALNELLDLIS